MSELEDRNSSNRCSKTLWSRVQLRGKEKNIDDSKRNRFDSNISRLIITTNAQKNCRVDWYSYNYITVWGNKNGVFDVNVCEENRPKLPNHGIERPVLSFAFVKIELFYFKYVCLTRGNISSSHQNISFYNDYSTYRARLVCGS